MKKKILFSAFIAISIWMVTSTNNSTNAFSSLPLNGLTGSPGDLGNTCAACHGGTVGAITNVIFSDIPATGYVPGSTYNFSVTMVGNATSIAYGFEMVCEEAVTNLNKGTWIAGIGTGISGDYIKHSVKGTGSSHTWVFQWIAPSTVSSITFYGSFFFPNSVTSNNVKKSSVSYFGNSTAISENKNNLTVSVFPNPTTKSLNILSPDLFTQGKIYSNEGKWIKSLTINELTEKSIDVSELSNGLYFLEIVSENQSFKSKFSKQN